MARIKFRLIHLIALMTIVCISIPSYFWFKEYQHKQRLERMRVVVSEMQSVIVEQARQAGTESLEYQLDPSRFKRNPELDLKADLLQQEANELAKGLEPIEVHGIMNPTRVDQK